MTNDLMIKEIIKSEMALKSSKESNDKSVKEPKEKLDYNKYILFRKQLGKENSKHVKQERYYKYITSIAISHNRKLYNKLCEEKGEYYARIYLYASYNVTALNNEYVILDNYE